MAFLWFSRRKPDAEKQDFGDEKKLAAPSLPAVGNDGFQSVVIDRPGVTFVFCWASWCRPCHKMGAVVEQVAEDLSDVFFVSLNIEEAAETAALFNVSGTPTFLLFEDGKLRASRFGSLSAKKLKGWIRDNIDQA